MASESERRRGQSEVIGVVLLTGVIVVVVSLIGTVVLGSLLGESDREPLAAIEGGFEDGNVTLKHTGGDSLPTADLLVVLRNGGEERLRMDSTMNSTNATFVGGQAESGRFGPGDVWTYNHSQSELVRVSVVDRGSGTTIYTERFELG
ncbi:hypothetical protein BRC62_05470 [Halobacteriales archaeon QH_10_67_13]|nr:MAG: hypothetical protein BRC62_05470 [Halobacteriales archaeon QH_10_67_13]